MTRDRADLLPVLLRRHLGVDQPVLEEDVHLAKYVGHSGDQLVHRETKPREMAPLHSRRFEVPTRTVTFSGRRALFCTLKMHRTRGRVSERPSLTAPSPCPLRSRSPHTYVTGETGTAAYDATACVCARAAAYVFREVIVTAM